MSACTPLSSEATLKPPQHTARRQQEAFDRFQQEYNQHRPHEALQDHTPASFYTPSCRPMPRRVPEVEYDADVLVRAAFPQQGQFPHAGPAHVSERDFRLRMDRSTRSRRALPSSSVWTGAAGLSGQLPPRLLSYAEPRSASSARAESLTPPVEMPAGGKPGKSEAQDFHPSPSLEIARAISTFPQARRLPLYFLMRARIELQRKCYLCPRINVFPMSPDAQPFCDDDKTRKTATRRPPSIIRKN